MFIYHCLDQEDFEEIESYASVKRLKGKLKKVPVRLRTSGVNNDNTIHKGLRKIITRNVNVTDFNQVFDVLITCIYPLDQLLYIYILFLIHISMISKVQIYCGLVWFVQSLPILLTTK